MHFSRFSTIATLVLCAALPSALASPAPAPAAPIDTDVLPAAMQKNTLDSPVAREVVDNTHTLFLSHSTSTNSSASPSATSTASLNAALQGLSMMTPLAMGLLTAGGMFAVTFL